MQNYYTLKWFSEAESAPIRSASKFCFDLDGRNFFQLLFWIFFRSIKKFSTKFFEIQKKIEVNFGFRKIQDFFFENVMKIFNTKIMKNIFLAKKCFLQKIMFSIKNFQKKSDRPKKYFLKKLRFFFEHQYRFKNSLRIEWEHSQPLKFTPKHSNLRPMNLYQERPGFWAIKKNQC